jgi:nitrogen fixation protein NifX
MDKILIGIVSTDGKNINEHFGRARDFYIYEINGNEINFIEKREISGAEGKWEIYYESLKDCSYIFAGAAGVHPVNFFAQKGIRVASGEGNIEKALKGFIKRRHIIEKMNFGIGKDTDIVVTNTSGCSGGGCGTFSGCGDNQNACNEGSGCR